MAQDYITVDDILNITFNKFSQPNRQVFVDSANAELEDFAERLGIMDPLDIKMPIHHGIKEYAIRYCLSEFAESMIGANDGSIGEVDKYKDLFERSEYLINQKKPRVTKEMFDGTVKTRKDRSVSFGRRTRT